ncbi:hypothetical protein [Marinobacter sp. MIT932201]|uniref:hypothetical protein n=1 Tax=Marinobacter sp. MIT932201 TaxID=3096995 RepID=UPI00399C4050
MNNQLHNQVTYTAGQMKQSALFGEDVVLTTDMFVLLQLFTHYRGHDIPKDFFGLSHTYHSVFTHPDKRPKSSWSEARVLAAIRKCEEADLISYKEYDCGHKWTITQRGISARREAHSVNGGLRR